MVSSNIAPATTASLVLEAVTSPPILVIKTVPVPNTPPNGSALVEILHAPIQPTHSAILSGQVPYLTFPVPFTPGNVAVGRILSPLPPDSTSLQPGNLVFVDSFIRARDAPRDSQIMFGAHDGSTPGEKRMFAEAYRHGTWSEVTAVPLENCHKIDEDAIKSQGLETKDLVYIYRLIVAMGGVRATDLSAGKTVAIGPAAGAFSGAMVEMASAIGCKVIALTRPGKSEAKLARMSEFSPRVSVAVITGDKEKDVATIRSFLPAGSPGLDAFIEYSPPLMEAPAHVAAAIECIRPGGKMGLMGALMHLEIPTHQFVFKNITLKGQYMYEREDVEATIKMVEMGLLKLGSKAGHELGGEYKLEEWNEALEEARKWDSWGQQVLFSLKKD